MQEVDQNAIEGAGVLKHQTVSRTRDNNKLGMCNALGQFFLIAARRQHILVANHDQRWGSNR